MGNTVEELKPKRMIERKKYEETEPRGLKINRICAENQKIRIKASKIKIEKEFQLKDQSEDEDI